MKFGWFKTSRYYPNYIIQELKRERYRDGEKDIISYIWQIKSSPWMKYFMLLFALICMYSNI